MMPTAPDARLHHVGGQFIWTGVQLRQFGRRADAATMRWKPGTEHVGDEAQLLFTADRARDGGRCADIACSPNQLRMRVAHLILTQAPTVVLVDQVPTREPVVDHPARTAQGTCAERLGTERHDAKDYRYAVSAMALTTRGTLCA